MFINKIENKAPSGKDAFHLINNVKQAAQIANKILPGIDTGVVTGSVIINTPQNNTPPTNKLKIANSTPAPWIKPVIKDTTNTVTKYVTDNLGSMTFI